MSSEESSEESLEDESYTGPERRKAQRRNAVDRRESIRFEPEKDPRRSGKDRRSSKQDLWDKRDT